MNTPRFNSKHMMKLFNLGLHLNNQQSMILSHQNKYARLGTGDLSGNSAVISNPIWMTYQLIQFLQVFRRLLANNEKIIIINTDPVYSGYLEFFEGSGINYHEEAWAPGTLTNAHAENGLAVEEMSLVVLISARVEDRKVILSEIQSRDLPVMNLSPYSVDKNLFSGVAIPNRNFLHFYLQLIRHSVLAHQKKNWPLLSSSVLLGNSFNQLNGEDNDCLNQIQQLFTRLKKKRKSRSRQLSSKGGISRKAKSRK